MIDIEMADAEKSLEKFCNANGFEYNFNFSKFPIVATVKQDDNLKNQMVLEDVESDKVFGDIKFIFGDELQVSVSDDFIISDDALTKLKNSFKKIHYLYLQIYFRELKEKEVER